MTPVEMMVAGMLLVALSINGLYSVLTFHKLNDLEERL